LTKGEEKELGGYRIRFLDFDLSPHDVGQGGGVGAILEVRGEELQTQITPTIEFDPQGRRISKPAELPDGGFVYLGQIRADAGQIQITLGSGEEILFLEVSRKPLINFVWLGVILISVGMLLAAQRRFSRL